MISGRLSRRYLCRPDGPEEVAMPGTEAVRSYIDGVDPAHRPLFDRVHRLIMTAHPDADVVLSYQIPTYKVGISPRRRARTAGRR
jgi:hypothetical protein